jgi:hypothetical protein
MLTWLGFFGKGAANFLVRIFTEFFFLKKPSLQSNFFPPKLSFPKYPILAGKNYFVKACIYFANKQGPVFFLNIGGYSLQDQNRIPMTTSRFLSASVFRAS